MIDLVIRGATIIDGSGAPGFEADVAVSRDRIVSVGSLDGAQAREEIDARGLTLAPGFIDAHTHDDRAILGGSGTMLCKLSQGVTSVIVGNCGISLFPVAFDRRPPAPLDLLGDSSWWRYESFAAYAAALEASAPAVNALALIGHMPLRIEAMKGDVDRAATATEIDHMRSRLEQALDEGGAGFSTGLWYVPSQQAATSEITALAQCAADRGGLYVTHLRDEGAAVEAAVEEALAIGQATGARVIISHHKCTAPENFGKSQTTLAMIDAASKKRAVGLDVYPYNASSTALRPDLVRPDIRTQISWSLPHPDRAGQDLADIAAEWNLPLDETAKRLLPAGAVYFSMDEAEVRRILSHPLAMVGSDGLPHDERPHPRLWGTFPRVLGHYARDVGLFDLPTAVHKMTGLTASTFGIADRGILREGAFADLTLFDATRIIDRADFINPVQASLGVVATWVNGRLAYDETRGATGDNAGRLLRRISR